MNCENFCSFFASGMVYYTCNQEYKGALNMGVGEKIRKIRITAGLTQKELGGKIGIDSATVGKYERGLINPKIETIEKFATALNVNLAELCADSIAQMAESALQNAGNIPQITADTMLKLATQSGTLDNFGAQLAGTEMVGQANEAYLKQLQALEKDFSRLNQEGKGKALERVHELTEIPRYTIPEIKPPEDQ